MRSRSQTVFLGDQAASCWYNQFQMVDQYRMTPNDQTRDKTIRGHRQRADTQTPSSPLMSS